MIPAGARQALGIAALLTGGLPWACASASERCYERGGRWFVSARDLDRGACMMPSSDGGRPCRDKRDCNLLCLCPPDVRVGGPRADEPLEGADMTGECATYPPVSGSGFTCEIIGGRLTRRGTIVD